MTAKRRERPMPGATPGFAAPTLTPEVGPLKVGAQAQPPALPSLDVDQDDAPEVPARRPSRPGRTRGGRKPPPPVEGSVPTTIRFDPQEHSEVKRFIVDLEIEAGRRHLDRAEVIRELLRLAREHEPTRKALLRRIRQ